MFPDPNPSNGCTCSAPSLVQLDWQVRTRVRDALIPTRTLYFLFQTLVHPSLITESKYYIHRYKTKTTTVMVFTVSIHTVLSPIYIYIYKKTIHLLLHIQSAEPTMVDSYECAGSIVCGRSWTSSSVPTRIKTHAKLYA